MAHQINLTDQEIAILCTALAAVAPSGGGSQPRTLLLKVMGQTGFEPQLPATVAYQACAAQEFFGDDEWMTLGEEGRIPELPTA